MHNEYLQPHGEIRGSCYWYNQSFNANNPDHIEVDDDHIDQDFYVYVTIKRIKQYTLSWNGFNEQTQVQCMDYPPLSLIFSSFICICVCVYYLYLYHKSACNNRLTFAFATNVRGTIATARHFLQSSGSAKIQIMFGTKQHT